MWLMTIPIVVSMFILGALIPCSGSAADVPNVGQLLKDIQKDPTVEKRRPAAEIMTPTPTPTPTPTSAAVLVKGFRVTGASKAYAAKIKNLLKGFVNEKLTYDQFEKTAELVNSFNSKNGYGNIQAHIPRQIPKGGIVEINVIKRTFATSDAAPDAGRILQDIQKAPTIEKSRPAPEISAPAPAPVPAAPAPEGAVVQVKGFRVMGNSAVASEELNVLLMGFVNQKLTFGQLEKVADLVTLLYKEKGYLTSKAYIPQQEVKEGIIDLHVVEGTVAKGGIKVNEDEGRRLDREYAHGILGDSIQEGAALRKQDVERGLLLLNDLPGVSVRSTIVPGATVGTSDLLVEAKEGRLVSASLGSDNLGNRYTGQVRGTVSLNLNDPSGRGDIFGVTQITSGDDMNYVRPFYTIPINNYGTKFGIAYSWMEYALGKELASQHLDGSANIISGYLTHPIIRSMEGNLYASFNYDYKLLVDRAAGVVTDDKNIHVFTLGLTGDTNDSLLGGGITSGSITATSGLLDLSGSAGNLASDTASAKTNGTYYRFNANLSRTQTLPADFSFAVLGASQLALNNLDSSEKFSLGGPSGVRAFPISEGFADGGYTVSTELRYDIPPIVPKLNLQLAGFYDNGGVISLHKNLWSGWQGSNPNLRITIT